MDYQVAVPEVGMTKEQKAEFDHAKQTLETNELPKIVGGRLDEFGGWSILDEVSGRIWGHGPGEATNVQVKKTMLAWLFPQTIKVVDE